MPESKSIFRPLATTIFASLMLINTGHSQSNSAPVLNFNTPSASATFEVGTPVFVHVNASDPDGSVSNVRLSVDGDFLRQENVDPYEWGNRPGDTILENLSVGVHTLTAVATDNDGAATTESILIEIVAGSVEDTDSPVEDTDSPVVSFSSPGNGETFAMDSQISVTVNATDPDGSIENVRLSVDGEFVRQENRFPYEWEDTVLQNLDAGTHELLAVATDNAGNSSAETITITVIESDVPALPSGGNFLNTQLISHDFNNGQLAPFYECTTGSPNFVRVVDGRAMAYWTEDGFNGSRTSRGAEFCDAQRGVDRALEMATLKEGWMGFTLNVEGGHSRSSDSALAQVFGFADSSDFFSWSGLLSLVDGDLGIVHRAGGGSNNTTSTLIENFEYDKDHDIVIGFVVSNRGEGRFQVWVNGNLEHSRTNINFGLGDFDSSDVQTNGSRTTFKLGMYNHTTDYRNGEERIVYYDNVTWYAGSNGFSIVDPR